MKKEHFELEKRSEGMKRKDCSENRELSCVAAAAAAKSLQCSLNLCSSLPPPGHIKTLHFPSSFAVRYGSAPECQPIGCGRSAFVN